jgi:quercetin dioxygenase-like cupin family protein
MFSAMKVVKVLVGATMIATSAPARAEETEPAMIAVSPSEVRWSDAPPVFPRGAKSAVILGDPGKEGFFVVRVKYPAGYRLPAHWHPGDETVTVLQGTFFIGFGDKMDTARAKAMPAGSFFSTPARVHHFSFTKTETVIQVTGMGPIGLSYVNPADDPTRTAKNRQP